MEVMQIETEDNTVEKEDVAEIDVSMLGHVGGGFGVPGI